MTGDLLLEFDNEVEKITKQINTKVVTFFNDLKRVAPVKTGTFNSAYELIRDGKMQWEIYNPMEYASILWNGRITINGKTYGSEQWQEGGDPMFEKFKRELNDTI